jgi:hypothetical protein
MANVEQAGKPSIDNFKSRLRPLPKSDYTLRLRPHAPTADERAARLAGPARRAAAQSARFPAAGANTLAPIVGRAFPRRAMVLLAAFAATMVGCSSPGHFSDAPGRVNI